MAKLMKCTVCGGKVSSTADICPHCGATDEEVDIVYNAPEKPITDWRAVLLLLIVGAVVINFNLSTTIEDDRESIPVENIKTEAQLQYEAEAKRISNRNRDAQVALRRYIRDNLRDPDSYDIIYTSKALEHSNGTFSMQHKYRAKNGFGGMNVEEKVFIFSKSGSIISVN